MKPICFRCAAAAILLAICLLFTSCQSKSTSEFRDFQYFAMDTVVTLRLASGDPNVDPARAADSCAAVLARLESELSSHDPSSAVSRLNAGEQAELPASVSDVLETALAASALSEGAYDCTVGSLIELWNVTGGGPVPSPDAIENALSHTGADKFRFDSPAVQLDPEARIDLGGVGKGYAAEKAVEALKEAGVPYGLVSLGGNVGIIGPREDGSPYKIGVRDPEQPEDPSAVLGYLYLTSGFVSVSGDYERYFEENGVRYHHILDPKTGYPAESGLHSAAVWSENGAWADALSTALFVLGEENALTLYEKAQADDSVPPFEAVLVSADGRIILTDGLKNNFTLSGSRYQLAE